MDETIGNESLSAWAVDESHCWIQTRLPKLAKQLAKLDGARVVAVGVHGGYLRTFEVPYTLPWVQRNVILKINPQKSA